MTRLAYELTQFVNDLRTITAEMRDPRASRVRVPLGSGEHGSFQPDTVFGRSRRVAVPRRSRMVLVKKMSMRDRS